MITIHNIKRLHLEKEKADEIEEQATQLRRLFTITFSVVKVEADSLTIRVRQTKPFHDNVLTRKKLVDLTKEFWRKFYPEMTIHVAAEEYKTTVVDVVTPEWLLIQMNKNKIKLKTMSADTGIHKSTLSGLINGHKPLSRVTQGLFYYYFLSKEVVINK